jgi:hypothetical protein
MSRQNVEHYMRFKDQMRVAAQGQKRLRLVSNEDYRPRTFGRLYHRCQTPDLENFLAILENFRKKCCKVSHFGGEWCNGSLSVSGLSILKSFARSRKHPHFDPAFSGCFWRVRKTRNAA